MRACIKHNGTLTAELASSPAASQSERIVRSTLADSSRDLFPSQREVISLALWFSVLVDGSSVAALTRVFWPFMVLILSNGRYGTKVGLKRENSTVKSVFF